MGWAQILFTLGLVTEASQNSAVKDWTILVYMAADNNLESRAYADIRELEKVGSSENRNIVVFIDDTSKDSLTLEIQKAQRPYLGREREHQSKILFTDGEVDSGNSEVLNTFLRRAKERYPALHYALVIWGHGYGWSGDELGSELRPLAVAGDNSSGRWIQTQDLARVLRERFENHVDILVFDACLMGSSEVIDAVSPYARYLISSQEDLPGGGFPYYEILSDWDRLPTSASRLIVDAWIAATQRAYPADRHDLSVAAFDLAHWERFKDSLNSWLRVVNVSRIPIADLRALGRETVGVNSISQKDLFDYVRRIESFARERKMIRLQLASQQLLELRKRLIPFFYSSRQFADQMGLSVYLPTGWWDSEWNRREDSRRNTYRSLRFAFSSLWDEHLDLAFPIAP